MRRSGWSRSSEYAHDKAFTAQTYANNDAFTTGLLEYAFRFLS